MNERILDKWMARLREDKFPGRGPSMRSPDGRFDPLGVLCNMYREAHPGIDYPNWISRTDGWAWGYPGESTAFYPCEAVLEWAGMSHGEALQAGELWDVGARKPNGTVVPFKTLPEFAGWLAVNWGGSTKVCKVG